MLICVIEEDSGCRCVLMYRYECAYVHKQVCVCTYVLFKCLNMHLCSQHICIGECAHGCIVLCGALSLPGACWVRTSPHLPYLSLAFYSPVYGGLSPWSDK